MGRPNPARGRNPGGYGPRKPWGRTHKPTARDHHAMREAARKLRYLGFDAEMVETYNEEAGENVIAIETDAPIELVDEAYHAAWWLDTATSVYARPTKQSRARTGRLGPCTNCGEAVRPGHDKVIRGRWIRTEWECRECGTRGWYLNPEAFDDGADMDGGLREACPSCRVGNLEGVDTSGHPYEVWSCGSCGQDYEVDRETGMFNA